MDSPNNVHPFLDYFMFSDWAPDLIYTQMHIAGPNAPTILICKFQNFMFPCF